MHTQLKNKVAIITGATSGIGLATARLFAQQGASLVITGRRTSELAKLAEEIKREGGRVVSLAGDVKNESHAEALVSLAISEFGGLDIAFNNAGTLGAMGATHAIEKSGWNDTIAVNLTAGFLGAKYQIPAMLKRGSGSLIFTSTFVGHTVGMPEMAAYAASKSGLLGLTQVLATEYSPRGIRVNALLPGGTDTPMGRAVANTPEALEFVRGLHALKRLATPEEIATSALFLASEASSFMTGQNLVVDGGVSVNRT